MFDPETNHPFRDDEFSEGLGFRLGEKIGEIKLRDHIARRLGVILFRVEILSWPELAFGTGYISRSFEKVLGWPMREVSPKLFFSLLHKDDADRMGKADLSDMGDKWTSTFRLCTSSGSYVRMMAMTVREKNHLDGMMFPDPS